MRIFWLLFAVFIIVTVSSASTAFAATVDGRVVMKITDTVKDPGQSLDPYLGWINDGGFNEGVAGAADIDNAALDYKDSIVDTNWADFTTARVSMFSQGTEVAYASFGLAGTTKTDFFSLANVLASSWLDFGVPNNFFSIAGDSRINRHWFVERNYGGCGVDRGWMVVLDSTDPSARYTCNWSNQRLAIGAGDRGFLYAKGTANTNWNDAGTTGIADTFVVSVTMAPVPLPASALLILSGLGGLALTRRRSRQ